MKKIAFYPASLLILFFFSTCATVNPNQKQGTTEAIEAVEEHTTEILQQLDKTEASLNNLIDPNNADMEGAFNSYKQNVAKVVSLQKEFKNLSDKMISRNSSYLAQWQKETANYESTQLRRASEERREELNESFNEINEKSGDVKRALNMYINDIKEIESFLSKGLTQEGISGVTPLQTDIEQGSEEVQESINSLQTSIISVKKEMGRTES